VVSGRSVIPTQEFHQREGGVRLRCGPQLQGVPVVLLRLGPLLRVYGDGSGSGVVRQGGVALPHQLQVRFAAPAGGGFVRRSAARAND